MARNRILNLSNERRNVTLASRGNPSDYPGEEAIFSDLGVAAYSDGTSWNFGPTLIDSPTGIENVLGNNTPIIITNEMRTVPPGLPTLPMTLSGSANSWAIALPNDAITAAQQYHSSIYNDANTYYVKPSTGSDSNTGLTPGLPFATVGQALKTATGAASRVVMLEDAVIATFELRANDPSQTTEQFKWLDGNGFNVVIRDSGPDLTTQAWVVDGVYTNCYKTTLTLAGTAALNRLLRTDRLDEEGLPSVVPKFASETLLDAALEGYFWDSVGKVLWVNFGGSNVQHQRGVLKGLYTASTGNSRIFAYGSKLGLSGITLEGVQFFTMDYAAYPTRRSEIWLHNCRAMWSNGKGVDLTNAGWLIASDTKFYSAKADLVNGFAASATGQGLILTLRCRFSKGGDRNLLAVDNTMQGTTAHGGCHHVGWGNVYELNNGSGVADTCTNNSDDVTWLVGCLIKSQAVTVNNLLFGSAATNSTRKVYLDSCISRGSTANDLAITTNATVYVYNSLIPTVTGGPAISYTPDAPPL